MRFLALLALLVVAAPAQAAALKVALYPFLDIEAYRERRETIRTEYTSLPSCRDGALPCRMSVRAKPKHYRAALLPDGTNCDVSIFFIPTRRGQSGSWKVKDGCHVVLRRTRSLTMPPGLFRPLASISFPDLGDALDGIDTQAVLARGQQAQRYRWVRAATRKYQSNDKPTRNIRGAVFTEKFASTWVEPRVYLDNFIDQATVGEGYEVFEPYITYRYVNAPTGPACWECDIWTNQYPIRNHALTGWRRRTDGGRNHWSEAVAVMGARLGYSYGCAFGGDLPGGSAGDCRTRSKTVSTSPLY
jgi:hypothetical protein